MGEEIALSGRILLDAVEERENRSLGEVWRRHLDSASHMCDELRVRSRPQISKEGAFGRRPDGVFFMRDG